MIFTFILSLSLFLVSCGDTNFSGSNPVDEYGEPSLDEETYGNPLTWLWGCDGISSQSESSLSGEGTFTVSRDLDTTYLRFKGRSCLTGTNKRDIVLLIDASNSMASALYGNPASDPISNGTCGRLKAVRSTFSAINSNKNSDVHFSIVTFSDKVLASSSNFFKTEKEVYQDLLSSSSKSSITDVICDSDGGTDYNVALTKAKEVLDSHARTGSSKEVYFISDGEPWPAESNGISVANSLKAENTVISTIMIAHLDDSVMKNQIASSTPSGKKLHVRIDKAEDLVKALSKLTASNIVKAEVKYRSLSGGNWVTYDVSDKVSGSSYDFVTPIKIDVGECPNGIEVIYSYWDEYKNSISLKGELKW